ncbi:MAG: hypothetical protein D6815_05440 [Candidatus Dadabacteria bacterium]|nr:MAG: hypothetical protein D6815_05440 [Candidatus Dadabacteria bacterium]
MSHAPQWTIERLLAGLDELERVLGPGSADVLGRVRLRLREAAARRDLGDRRAAALAVATCLAELAAMGDRFGPAEGAMMRALSSAFLAGLARQDRSQVEAALAAIEARAGKRKKQ